MSQKHSSGIAAKWQAHAPVFAALGDETRLSLVVRLSRGQRCSISQLTEGSGLTRQAITKHLHTLADAGLVRSSRDGREQTWELLPDRLVEARQYLAVISDQWDQAIERLRELVETET